ncbi:MAG: tRNA pseudouridine(55) synthase TruB [Lachnospiraceae bacterium]|nr:tRNA pseudouridine(55) synthase TruB [Lachnospiraceae bacterium]
MNGIIIVYKEKGYTSHDVVARLRGILKTKKIGHTGTLDPDAVGVLPVCVGNATKVADILTDRDKEYICEMRLGVTTDTLDMTGNVLSECPQNAVMTLDDRDITDVIASFVGDIMQVPPMYSALKVGGRKLCDLARQGVEIERKPRPVTIHSIEILSMCLPVVKFRVECSKGTYIRTLCDDIGRTLGVGAAMESLVRSRVGRFTLDEARTLDEIEQFISDHVDESCHLDTSPLFIGVDELFDYRKVFVSSDRLLYNGNPMTADDFEAAPAAAYDHENFLVYDSHGAFKAVYEFSSQTRFFKPVKMFL